MDDLAVADTVTTGHYLTLDSPCKNKQQDVHMLPIQMPNRLIITATHTALLYNPYLPYQALEKDVIFVLEAAGLDETGVMCALT